MCCHFSSPGSSSLSSFTCDCKHIKETLVAHKSDSGLSNSIMFTYLIFIMSLLSSFKVETELYNSHPRSGVGERTGAGQVWLYKNTSFYGTNDQRDFNVDCILFYLL
jgi:hypothetical protein